MYSRCLLLSLPAAPLTFPPHNKRAPLNALYGVIVGVLESCHLIRSENFAFPQSHKTETSGCAERLKTPCNSCASSIDYFMLSLGMRRPLSTMFSFTTIIWLCLTSIVMSRRNLRSDQPQRREVYFFIRFYNDQLIVLLLRTNLDLDLSRM